MMSLSTIRELSAQAARDAARAHVTPLIIEQEDMPRVAEIIRHIPNIGSYVPTGWTLQQTYFVDSSGFGADDEPALAFERFCDVVLPGFGYAIIEAGQFQVRVDRFALARQPKRAAVPGSNGTFTP